MNTLLKEYIRRGLFFPISFISGITTPAFALLSLNIGMALYSLVTTLLMPLTHLFGFYLVEVPTGATRPIYVYQSLKKIVEIDNRNQSIY